MTETTGYARPMPNSVKRRLVAQHLVRWGGASSNVEIAHAVGVSTKLVASERQSYER